MHRAVPALRNRYFTSLTHDKQFVPWEPPNLPGGMALPDPVYFGRALAQMDGRLGAGGLTVYMTQDLEALPSYGMDVVALVIGDEFTRVPGYCDRVRAVFKNHPIRPALTSSVVREPSWLNLWWLVAYLRAWAYHFPGARRYRRERRRGWVAPIFRVPVGTANQIELPIKPLPERATDLFFAGSVLHRPGAVSPTRERYAPKTIAREAMIREAKRIADRRPDLSVDVVLTEQFVASIVADAVDYSTRLMDARIALVPRGTSPDTYRFWQALRCGCITIVDTVPRHPWFYDDAPVVRLGRWEDLEQVVDGLLSDDRRMAELHERSLAWWTERGSEVAVGSYMAHKLDALEAAAPPARGRTG